MASAIKKIKATEYVCQIYFRQLLNIIRNSGLNCRLEVDFEAIEKQYPSLLQSYNFTGISVYRLFEFISYEARMGRECIFHLGVDGLVFHEYLYAFCDSDFSEENTDFDQFPLLFDGFEESTDNNLVAMYHCGEVFLYNKQGEFLNVSRSPNIYDYGLLGVTFLNDVFLTIDYSDENNGQHIELLKYDNEQLFPTNCSSLDLLNIMESKYCEWGLNVLSEELRDHKDAILLAFSKKYFSNLRRINLIYVSARLRDDEDIAELAVEEWFENYMLLSDRLKNEKSLAIRFIKEYPSHFKYLPDGLKNDRSFILNAVASKPKVIDYLQDHFQTDPEIVSLAMQSYPGAYAYYLRFAPPEFFEDKSNVIEAVARYPKALLQLSQEYMNDEDVLGAAIEKDASLGADIPILQTNREMALRMVGLNRELLVYLKKFSTDLSFALVCVREDGLCLSYFPEAIQNNKQLVMEAYNQNNRAIIAVNDELRTDPEIAQLLQQEMVKIKHEEDDLWGIQPFPQPPELKGPDGFCC